eukprot:20179-Heterococcus_DN1.PRE.2
MSAYLHQLAGATAHSGTDDCSFNDEQVPAGTAVSCSVQVQHAEAQLCSPIGATAYKSAFSSTSTALLITTCTICELFIVAQLQINSREDDQTVAPQTAVSQHVSKIGNLPTAQSYSTLYLFARASWELL